jgi:hypothetical protein
MRVPAACQLRVGGFEFPQVHRGVSDSVPVAFGDLEEEILHVELMTSRRLQNALPFRQFPHPPHFSFPSL